MKLIQELSKLTEAPSLKDMSDDDLIDMHGDLSNSHGDEDSIQQIEAELRKRGITQNGRADPEAIAELEDMNLGELVDKFMDKSNHHHTEGRRGLETLASICNAIGYKDPNGYGQINRSTSLGDIFTFFEDNSGAIEAVIEWVKDRGANEWEDSLRERIIDEISESVTVTEGKVVTDPWAAEMKKALSLRLPSFISADDGHWVAKDKAKDAIEALYAAGFKKDSKSSTKDWVVINSKVAGKGMTFDFDDPDEKNKVGIRFFDDSKK